MSNLKIQGNASGTGTTTLQSGNTNSNLTLALPIADGTANQALVTDGAGVLSFASTGSGDVVGPASSVDSELALFNSTTGKLIKRASLTGLVKATSGVASAATAGTDYLAPPSGTAILKANSGGALANATAGTDYTSPSSTETMTNKTLTNPTVTNYVESVVAIGTVTTTNTISLTSGTVQTATLTASTACTFTMPTATAGKSFILLLKQAASTGNGTATFTGVKWGTAGAPTISATAGKMDILTFVADGTNWYGSIAQGYTP
jgi:hypothetical protein